MAATAERVGILVSGDAGFFSAAKTLYQKLAAHGEVEVVCGLSSMQMLCARLGAAYDDAVWLSLHGRKGSLLGAVSYNRKVFALTGGDQNAAEAVPVACGRRAGACARGARRKPWRGRRTGGHRFGGRAGGQACGSLAVLLIENDRPGNPNLPSGTATWNGAACHDKQEARWTAVNLLDLRATDVVYDVGAAPARCPWRWPDGCGAAWYTRLSGGAEGLP